MECARLLLDAGSKHLKDRSGITPLDDAKRYGYKKMQRLIESHFQLGWALFIILKNQYIINLNRTSELSWTLRMMYFLNFVMVLIFSICFQAIEYHVIVLILVANIQFLSYGYFEYGFHVWESFTHVFWIILADKKFQFWMLW